MSHDCCKPQEVKKGRVASFDPFIIGIIALTVILLVGAVIWGTKIGGSTDVSSDSAVALQVDANSYDWGTIDYDGGVVTKSFTITNTSGSTLKLYNVLTSCICTTAQLKTTGQTSKKFGMHEKSSGVFEVNPNESAELLVEFDPAFHGPSGVGPVTRTVTLNTNDQKNSTLTFNLTGNVVKK